MPESFPSAPASVAPSRAPRAVRVLRAMPVAATPRPRPLGDGALLAVVTLIGLCGLATAGLLGLALARWMATSSSDVLPVVGGGLGVAVILLGLAVLVTAQARGRGGRG
ncbi:hypothetical protein SAMN02745673_03283 [Marinactinospora thermotolerans DSM 45154]|uniref:Uncharacterized protein n=2 Tax=Marinactinospora thermotolerans TaxID=531310 RepID=A0A1T4S8D3_9ACTN|nr:hypothetical protein SAMN02745673_03283 [Marinactinospora thermotolerans DSM 45154]